MSDRLPGRARSSAAQAQSLRAPLPFQSSPVMVVPGGAYMVARSKVPAVAAEVIRVAIPRKVLPLVGHKDCALCPAAALNTHDRLALTSTCPVWASQASTL